MSTQATIPEDRVDAKVIAKKYGLDVSTVLKRAKKGLIPCIRIGGSVRFDLAAVIAAIEGPK